MPRKASTSTSSVEKLSSASFLWGIALLAAAVLIFLAVASFSVEDSPLWSEPHSENWVGYAGAVISYGIVVLFAGRWAGFGVAVLIGIWGWTLIRRLHWLKSFELSVFTSAMTLWASAFIGLVGGVLTESSAVDMYPHCGMFGFSAAGFLDELLGVFGAIISMLVVAIALIGIYVREFAHWIEERFNATVVRASEIKTLRANWFRPGKSISDTVAWPSDVLDKNTLQSDTALVPRSESVAGDGEPGKVIHDLSKAVRRQRSSADQLAIQIEDRTGYVYPPLDLFNAPKQGQETGMSEEELRRNSELLEKTLQTFGVQAKVVRVNPGPVITRFDLEPAPGVKVSRIEGLADDIALALRARGLRILAPIPGVAAVGVEMANPKPAIVTFREVAESSAYQNSGSRLTIALGRTVQGDIFVADLASLPHLLIAGTTGSGKSVCVNSIITSILLRTTPSDVQLVLIDPKKLELSAYNELRNHHVTHRPDLSEYVITRPDEAVKVLRSCLLEMERRYDLLAERGARHLGEYNEMVLEDPGEGDQPLPFVVVVIDELADLMVTAQREVEEPIARLAQLARAVGIHLVVATQRPSVDVITGVIKANFPARIAFRVAMKVDSRTILDTNGAEMLLGQGDMLFQHPEEPAPIRVQGALLTSVEISRVISHIVKQPAPREKLILPLDPEEVHDQSGSFLDPNERDPFFGEAAKIVVRTGQGSVSILQRRLKVGYSRAARLVDQLERAGIVGPFDGSKARAVLVDERFLDANPDL